MILKSLWCLVSPDTFESFVECRVFVHPLLESIKIVAVSAHSTIRELGWIGTSEFRILLYVNQLNSRHLSILEVQSKATCTELTPLPNRYSPP
jgi:hypothetical protein